MNRRNFIKAGVLLGISSTALQAAVDKKTEKKCVYIYLGGGISHIEFINPIPLAPSEFRAINGAITTNSGYEIGGNFKELAKCSELFTTVRSFHHRDANHHTAAHWVNTGHLGFNIPEGGSAKEPSYGSIVCREYEPNSQNGMPHYIKVNRIPHDGPSWLGSKFMGYDNDQESTKNLELRISRDKFQHRTKMLNEINKLSFKSGNTQKLFKDWQDIRDTAIEVITGDVSTAFKVELENDNVKQKYMLDSSGFGKSLLSARRLLENGCKFVSLSNDGWDMHSDIKDGFNNRAVELDKLLAIFLQDLKERGLLKDTLVVVCSEFGRTSRINNTAGRDHMPSCNSLLLAGTNYGGSLIGKTDDKATAVSDKPFIPEDLCWTILNHFEIEKDLTIIDNQRRPKHMIDKEAKLIV